MYKLIVIFAALVPLILLVRTIFGSRSKKASRAFSEFKKQIDLLVWVILFIIGCASVYSIGELNSFLMAMTLRECRFQPNSTPCKARVNRVSLNLVSFQFGGHPTD